MMLFVIFLAMCTYMVVTLTVEHFVSQFIITVVVTLFLHELGHILAIIYYNWTEKRKPLDFRIHLSWHSFEVHHLTFIKKYKNIIIACAGSIFPFLLSIVYFKLFNGPLAGMLFFSSILNLALLLPIFPDGKNVLNNMAKGE